MNALTKAFVVVVTILSVVLVALVVPFAARVPDYASQYEQMKQDRDTQLALASEAATKIRNDIAKAGTELEDISAKNSQLESELGVKDNEIKSLQAKLGQAQVTLDRYSAANEINSRMIETKSGQITKQADLIKEQLGAISELTGQRSDLSQALIESRSRERRLSDNYLRIQEELKAMQQQLLEKTALLKTATEELEAFKEGAEERVAEATAVQPPDGVAIRGSVTKIDQVTDGLTFVQLNVGTRDLVKEGMEFTVYRGDEFVGKVQIASVDTADSVGQLTLGGGVQEGDAVRAGGR